MLNAETIAKTKKGVIIVNAARGGLIDEQALADAITSGHVRAAGIDVFETEPCTDSPLFNLPQVVVTRTWAPPPPRRRIAPAPMSPSPCSSPSPGSSCRARSMSPAAR